MTVGRVWALDGQPYLLVYPHRHVKGREFPVVALEDIMAVREVEAFLRSYRLDFQLLGVQLPDKAGSEVFPAEALEKIIGWQGHVIHICSRSIPPSLLQFARGAGLPYELREIGTNRTYLLDREIRAKLPSPTRSVPPQWKDLSLVARPGRPHGAGLVYILAGIRAMGTWGAASYLTQPSKVRELSHHLPSACQFAAVVETEFDPYTHKIGESRLRVTPKVF